MMISRRGAVLASVLIFFMLFVVFTDLNGWGIQNAFDSEHHNPDFDGHRHTTRFPGVTVVKYETPAPLPIGQENGNDGDLPDDMHHTPIPKNQHKNNNNNNNVEEKKQTCEETINLEIEQKRKELIPTPSPPDGMDDGNDNNNKQKNDEDVEKIEEQLKEMKSNLLSERCGSGGDGKIRNDNNNIHQQQQEVQQQEPLRKSRLEQTNKIPLDPDLNEWQFEDPKLDGALYNVSGKTSLSVYEQQNSQLFSSSSAKKSKFISHLQWRGKCWYEVRNFCVVNGDLVLYHDPASSKDVRRDSLRMCNEFSQRSPLIRLKYRSEPTPDILPGPLLTRTPGWVLQFWCQDLFHSTLSLMPAFHTKPLLKKLFVEHSLAAGFVSSKEEAERIMTEPDIYLRIARGRRQKGQYCHIKYGHPLSYNESHNKKWGGDKQFPFAGNPYWSMYGVLSKDPWRLHPLYRGATKKTACYRTGIIDKLYVKDIVRTQAREYSNAMLENLNVTKSQQGRECGKYRMTIIDRRGKTRRLTNIPEIIEIAKKVGFETVRAVAFEHLTLQQQIRLVTDTDLLFGVHGNGLIWQQFLKQGSCLIELVHTWYQPYAKLFGHSYFHSSIKKNPFYKKNGEYVPFAHNETEVEELLVKAKAALDKTSCGVTEALPNDKLDLMYSGCAPHC